MMSKGRRIIGIMNYHNIGMGFWGITDSTGKKWQPVNVHEQLKIEGARVRCTVVELDGLATSSMWGIPVKILSFQTPMP